MTEIDTSHVAKVIMNVWKDTPNTNSALAEVLRAVADELSYYLFLPGNDRRIIDASVVYEIANELEGK